MNETPITVVGNAVDDPTIRFTPNGVAVANLRIAHTDRKFNRQTNQFEDGDSLYLGVVCWKGHAENVAETVRRGMRLVVTGHLRMQTYEKKDGTRGSSYEIAEAEVAVSLRSATAKVTKTTAGGAPQQSQQQSGGGGWGQQPAADPWASQGTSGAPF